MFSFLLDNRTRAESFVLLQKPALLFFFLFSAYPSEELHIVSSILLGLGIFFCLQGWCSSLCLRPFATQNPSGFPSEQSASPPWCMGCSSIHGWPSSGHFESLRRNILQAVMFLPSKKVLQAVRFLARNIFRLPCLLPYLPAWFCCLFRSLKNLSTLSPLKSGAENTLAFLCLPPHLK